MNLAAGGYETGMKRALVLVLSAAALTSGLAAPASSRSTARPVLKLVQRMPLEVQGLHFKLRERVRVTATSDTNSVVRTVRTRARGTFTVDLGRWDTCEKITVKARGRRGDRATLVVEPPPPPPTEALPNRGCWGL